MSLFVSHGAPDLLITQVPAHDFLRELGTQLPKPRFVVVASAHWLTREPRIDVSEKPRTIHDFSGFGVELEAASYPAPGAPEVARRAIELLRRAGHDAAGVERGLDHGAWVPLTLLWPAADVPVFQLSLQPQRDARHHYELGRALAPLVREGDPKEGGLLLASGGATHDLSRLGTPDDGSAQAFDDWLVAKAEAGDVEALLDWKQAAPSPKRAHPTDDHLLPLFVALGAASLDSSNAAPARATTLHRSVTYGSLHMTAFRF